MIQHISLFLLGLVILGIGAECLIRGAVALARRLGISPFIIGLTIVGFGTSAPELVVTLSAVLNEKPALAVGNVVGSNIANIGLILGVAAIIRSFSCDMRLLRAEMPLMLAVTLLFWFMVRDNWLSRVDAAILLVIGLGFVRYVFRTAKREPAAVQAEFGEMALELSSRRRGVLLFLIGLVGLIGGAQIMVDSAVEMARSFGASELMIGLTVVAVGTSLPELATTVAGAVRGQTDIALGNIIGSNIFNILFILGMTGMVQPLYVSDGVLFEEIPVMALFTFLMLPILLNGLKVHRWEGAVLLIAYAGFITWQVRMAVK